MRNKLQDNEVAQTMQAEISLIWDKDLARFLRHSG